MIDGSSCRCSLQFMPKVMAMMMVMMLMMVRMMCDYCLQKGNMSEYKYFILAKKKYTNLNEERKN